MVFREMITKYCCAFCKTCYETVEEANKCEKNCHEKELVRQG